MRQARRHAAWRFGLLGASLLAGCGGGPRLALDPVPVQDDDRYDIPEPPFRDRDDYYDLIDYTIFKPVGQLADLPRDARKVAGKPKQAMNATPLDEVQDSSWFTNRIGRRRLSPDEIAQGPNRKPGPDLDHDWTIVGAKTQGVTPGFTIEDARGDRFVIKFDPKSDPELATGAEAIGTRLFWAMGYNTPENYLVHFRPEQLRIGPKATVRLELKKKRPMTQADLDIILAKVPQRPDGSIRCIASRYLKGKPLGPIPFIGVRDGDPNDVIRHEHRRELRGYKVFAAWLAHNDCREINSLDMYVEEDGRHFVKHYLIDFGATLGSASTGPNLKSEGYEYQFDVGQMVQSFASLGLLEREWLDLPPSGLVGVGPFDAQHFNPEHWKQNYPLPPFENTTARDGFWAAKIVACFDDELLRAAVGAAEFSDPRATEYMVQTLAARRDRIARYWFGRVNPLDEFEVVRSPSAAGASGASHAGKPGGAGGGPELRFEDLAVRHGLVAPRRYQVRIAGPGGKSLGGYDTDGRAITLAEPLRALGTPATDVAADRLLRVTLRSAGTKAGDWSKPVTVTLYLRPGGDLRVAAIERDE